MPVTLSSIKFYDAFTGAMGGGIDYLLGSIGDKISASITFDVKWSTENVDMNFDTATKTITRVDPTTYFYPINYPPHYGISRSNASFITDGFQVGDDITVSGTPSNDGTYVIAAVTDTVITTVGALVMTENAPNAYIYGDTAVTGVDFFYNLIENDDTEDYRSKLDTVSSNRFNCGTCAIPMGATTMDALGASLGWQNGSATINDVSLINHVQKFIITHVFYITPLFINSWKNCLDNGQNPVNFFLDTECLRYICKIDCKFNNVAATPDHKSDWYASLKQGNTGFYDEYLNGFPANYTLTSITFTDVLTTLPVTGLQYGRDTAVDIRLTSVHGVVAGGCPVVLNQIYLPLTESQYVNTPTNLIDNFRFDRVQLKEGAAAVDGEQVGTDNQCITDATATALGANALQVEYVCSLAAAYNTMLAAQPEDNRNYLIFVTPQDGACATTVATDRNAVNCDTGVYTTNLEDDALFEIIGGDVYFYEYPDNVAVPYTDYKGWNNDFVTIGGNFQVEALSDVVLQTLKFKIEAVKSPNDNIVLEEYEFNVGAFEPDVNLIQQIDIEETTGYECNSDSIYANIILRRNVSLDTGNYAAYNFLYPLRLRYEDWVQLISANYLNGTQDWAAYQDDGWVITFNIYASCLDNTTDYVTDFVHSADLTQNEFDEKVPAPLNVDCQIETWDSTETDELNGIILGEENTVVLARFHGNFTALPAGMTGYYGVINLDNTTIGSVFWEKYISTEEDVVPDSIFLGYTADRAVLTKVSNVEITVKAIIDYTKIKELSGGIYPLNDLTLSARLGYLKDIDVILLEDGTPVLQEDYDCLIKD